MCWKIHKTGTVINDLIYQFKVEVLHATPLLQSMEFIPVQIFYSYRNRQINSFKIRPSLTTLKSGLISQNIHL
jgi:hypothetical protein